MRSLASVLVVGFLVVFTLGCNNKVVERNSDTIQQEQQEKILAEATAQVGMPAIKNFREKRVYKEILELRDQVNLPTYLYMVNAIPVVVPGHTSQGGKLHYIGASIGFPIPAATEFTNPQKIQWLKGDVGGAWRHVNMPQSDPNGLFPPASAEATWVLQVNPKTGKAEPQYYEERVTCKTFKLEFDSDELFQKMQGKSFSPPK